MQIPETFKQVIADTFYDKDIEIWTSGTIKDDEGSVIENGKLDKIDNQFIENYSKLFNNFFRNIR